MSEDWYRFDIDTDDWATRDPEASDHEELVISSLSAWRPDALTPGQADELLDARQWACGILARLAVRVAIFAQQEAAQHRCRARRMGDQVVDLTQPLNDVTDPLDGVTQSDGCGIRHCHLVPNDLSDSPYLNIQVPPGRLTAWRRAIARWLAEIAEEDQPWESGDGVPAATQPEPALDNVTPIRRGAM